MKIGIGLGISRWRKSGTSAPPAAPTVSGTISNQSVQQGTGVVTYSTAGAFTGSSLTYSLTGGGAGITINPETGVVSVDRAVVAVNVFSLTVRATNVSGFAETGFTLTVTAASAIAQSAIFGAFSLAGEGDWRPQLADGRVDNIASYDGLQSGSLGSHVPTITSGRLTFAGASGGPNGAVIQLTGVSGRTYNVTITQEANRRDIGKWADANRDRSVAGNVGKKIVVRQNAQLPPITRIVAGTDFISTSSTAQSFSGLNAPTFFEGEGPRTFDDEYHLHSWRGFPLSEFTIRWMRFADQKTHDSIVLETNGSRRAMNVTVEQNYFKIFYDVDGAGNWTTGFNSTGYVTNRYVYVTGSDELANISVKDNVMINGYLPIDVRHSGYSDISGNYIRDPYFDFRKHSMDAGTLGTDRVNFTGGNYFSVETNYSVNETANAPHLDVFQVVGGGAGSLVYHLEFNVAFMNTLVGVQTLFHSDRVAPQTGGFNWNIRGDVYIVDTTHAATCTWPDNVNLDHFMVLPNRLMTIPQSNPYNIIKFGSGLINEEAAYGTNVIKNSTTNGYTISAGLLAGMTLNTPGYIDSGAYTGANFAANLARWGDWATMPIATTYEDAMSYAQPVAASAFEAVSPYGHFTPGASLQSEYTLAGGSTLFATPVLTGISVTNLSTGAFTATSNLDLTTTLFWNVTAVAVADPHVIMDGVVGKTGVSAWGISNRVGPTGPCTGPGAATALAAGNYVLNIAVFNGRKKTAVYNVPFTAP